MNLKSNKNFIKENKKNCTNILKKSKTQPIKPFSNPEYGQVPNYIQTIKNKLSSEKDYIEMLIQAQAPAETKVLMDENERISILTGLKHKYDEVMQNFQVKNNSKGFSIH